MMKLQN